MFARTKAVTFAFFVLLSLFVFAGAAVGQDLCSGVGDCGRVWYNSGSVPWFFQTEVNHDGQNALRSGASSGGDCILNTTVTGPATVSFWWKLETPISGDGVTFLVDSVGVVFTADSTWAKYTHTITAAGPHLLSWAFFPSAGGGSAVLDQFLVEEADAPSGSVVINSGASLVGPGDVALSLTYSDGVGSGVTKMRFSNDGYTWTAWEDAATSRAWTLAPGDGYRTVCAQFLDKAGNRSAIYRDYILVDGTKPTGTISINGGASTTSSANVNIGLTWDDGAGSGVTRMRFSNDGATWSTWEPVAATHVHVLSATPGYQTVRVQFRDRAGNVSEKYADYILVTAP